MARITLRRDAHKTLDAIEEAIVKKGGKWRREHLGASLLGHKCDRYLWLHFRWAQNPEHDARRIRIFDRGNLEERRVVRDLKRAGFRVTTKDVITGLQVRFKRSHIGGSCDGMISGLPESKQTHVLEIKTANAKRWTRFAERGVKATSKEYWDQAQVYMREFNVERALFVIVNKDTEQLYCERAALDADYADAVLARAEGIVRAEAPPEKKDPDWPPCVYKSKDGTRWPCDYYDLCHGKGVPERNCRTCVSSTPCEGAQWRCEKHGDILSKGKQKRGCKDQRTIPPIVNAEVVKWSDKEAVWGFPDGTEYKEGDDGR